MIRLLLLMLAPLAFAGQVAAQPMDHSSMPGMKTPAAKAPAKPVRPAKAAKPRPIVTAAPPRAKAKPVAPDPHSGHDMPSAPSAELAKSPPATADMPGMATSPDPAVQSAAPAAPPAMPEAEIPNTPPPPAPKDHAAERFFDPTQMAAARAALRQEHGGARFSKVMANLAEYQTGSGGEGYRWDGQASTGGDIHRVIFKTEGEGARGEGVESAEAQLLYSRAIGPYFDVQAGLRQDFEPRGRTYVTVGFEGLAPYWFDVEGALFLSSKGELLARVEGSYDLRLTQRLILQPRAEVNLAAQDTAETLTGSGLSNAELGLRLRYELRREFAPYIGVTYDRKFGATAAYARASGEDVEATSFIVGIRAWF